MKRDIALLVGILTVFMTMACATNPASMTREYATEPTVVLGTVVEMAVTKGWFIDTETDSMAILRKSDPIVGEVVYQIRVVPGESGSRVTANIFNEDPRYGRQPMYASTYENFFDDLEAEL